MKRQMSETLLVGILLTLAGGFMDAYTYICRGGVFANAQTGNIVRFGMKVAEGQWKEALSFLVPVMAFIAGVLAADAIKDLFKNEVRFHWRQIVVAIEAAVIFGVAFLPHDFDMLANVTISFACALQYETFRKIRGNPCATTMCTGNLRTATEQLYIFIKKGNREAGRKSFEIYLIDAVFIAGAAGGSLMAVDYGITAVLAACVILTAGFFLMFMEELPEL